MSPLDHPKFGAMGVHLHIERQAGRSHHNEQRRGVAAEQLVQRVLRGAIAHQTQAGGPRIEVVAIPLAAGPATPKREWR